MTAWWESLTTFQSILALLGTAATAVLVIQLILSVFGLFGSVGGDSSDDFSGLEDLDSDGIPDFDLDGDGIPDFDFDGDGIPDFNFDLDGDGVPDFDLDGDGIPDFDLDNDGIPDFNGSGHTSATLHSAANAGHVSSHDINDGLTAFGFSDILSFRGIVAFTAIFSWLSLTLTENNVNTILSLLIGAICGFIVMVLIGYLFYRLKKANYSGTLDNRNAIGLTGRVYLRIPANETGSGKIQITVQSRYAELNAVTRWPQEIPTGETARVVSVRKDGTLVVEPTTVSKDIELHL